MKKLKYIYIWAMVLMLPFVLASCSDDDKLPIVTPSQTGTLTDKDGNEYHWVRIGNLDWMTENLRCDLPFYEDLDNEKWVNEFGWGLSLDGNAASWKKWYDAFGNYYSWQEAVDDAPEGWRLPTDDDFKALEKELGVSEKDLDKEGWRNGGSTLLTQTTEGTMLGFTYGGAVGPSLNSSAIELAHMYDYGYYWTATSVEVNKEPAAYARKITPGLNAINRLVILQEKRCLSVRYVRDAK